MNNVQNFKAVNEKLLKVFSLKESLEVAFAATSKAAEEGWFDPKYLGKIWTTPQASKGQKVKVRDYQGVTILYKNLYLEDLEVLVEILRKEEHWGTPYQRVVMWGQLHKLVAKDPQTHLILEHLHTGVEDEMPPLGAAYSVCNREFSTIFLDRCKFYRGIPQKDSFKRLIKFLKEGLSSGTITESSSYNTVRHGTCYSGGASSFACKLALNEKIYSLSLYGSDRGGSAYTPAHWGVDLDVELLEKEPWFLADFTLNDPRVEDEVIFRNIARILKAKYKGEIPFAGK